MQENYINFVTHSHIFKTQTLDEVEESGTSTWYRKMSVFKMVSETHQTIINYVKQIMLA